MKAYFLTVFLLFSLSVFSQDSLVYLKEVGFDSPFEKQVFDDFFIQRKTDFFNLFISGGHLLSTDKVETEKAKFNSFIADLNLSKYDDKKNEKKVKAIYEGVHKRYLAKYQQMADFEELFVSGAYNSATASALFALVLQQEDIPYMVKEDPDNIYLITFPQTDRILLKSDAGLSAQPIDPVYKQTFINNLKDQKIISSKEAANMDLNTLFDKYYFGTHQDITLTNLVGILYMNQAIMELQSKNYSKGYQQMEKAYLYFPSERIAYLLFQIGTEHLTTMESRDETHAEVLARVSRFSRYGVTSDMIKGEFGITVQRLLFEKSDVEKLTSYYETLQMQLRSPSLKNEISYIYQFEMGRFYYNQGKFSKALPFFEESLVSNPSSQDAVHAFINALIQVVGNDNLKIIDDFQRYSKLHAVLTENNNFNSILAAAFLIQSGREYDLGSPSQGAKYLAEFENMYENQPDLKVDSGAIGGVYSMIAVYYFRRGQTSKAKSIIEKGLTYAPDSYELQTRKRMIN